MHKEYATFEDVLDRTGRLIYTNVGVSMRPLLREGRDVMVIEKLTDAPGKYDAVLFRRPGVTGRGRYVLHRVLRDNGDGTYWIVGDNCTGGETVGRENILGVLTAVKRSKKTVEVTDPGYRLYVALWCAPYPLRFLILRLRRFILRALSGCKRRILRLLSKKHDNGAQ